MTLSRFELKYVLTCILFVLSFSVQSVKADDSGKKVLLLPPQAENGNLSNYDYVLNKVTTDLPNLNSSIFPADSIYLKDDIYKEYKNKPLESNNLVSIARTLNYDIVVSLVFRNVGSQTTLYSMVIDANQEKILVNETASIPNDKGEKAKFTKQLIRKLDASINNEFGVLVINTNPEASSVAVDEVGVGIAPVTIKLWANTRYNVSAERLGWEKASKNLKVDKGDTSEVVIKLRRLTEADKRQPISLRIWGNYGWPLYDQNFQSNDLFMKGNSMGGMLEFGYSWRLRFAAFGYKSRLSDEDFNGFEDAYGNTAPTGEATILQAAIVYGFNANNFGPYIALGFNGIRREMEVIDMEQASQYSESDYEAAWSFLFGFEWPIYKNIGMQFEIMYSTGFYEPDSWKDYGNYTPEQKRYWERAYSEFKDFTVMRLGIGYRI